MTADNIEHVISYWVMFQVFRSPALAGFAVISHWTPFLLFSLHAGALADRYDCRKLIQISQALFVVASVAWGVLFFTGSLRTWHAVVILVVHGVAGVVAAPASQLIIHQMVSNDELPSAIRLNASSRQLAILLGPAVGGGLMLMLGPAWGLIANVVLYLPLSILLTRIPYTGHASRDAVRRAQASGFGFGYAWDAIAGARVERRITSMIVLAGVTSFFVGNAFQAHMPEYALALGPDDRGAWYSVLLAANAAGAVLGVVLLETANVLGGGVRTAIVCAGLWGATMGSLPAGVELPAGDRAARAGGRVQHRVHVDGAGRCADPGAGERSRPNRRSLQYRDSRSARRQRPDGGHARHVRRRSTVPDVLRVDGGAHHARLVRVGDTRSGQPVGGSHGRKAHAVRRGRRLRASGSGLRARDGGRTLMAGPGEAPCAGIGVQSREFLPDRWSSPRTQVPGRGRSIP